MRMPIRENQALFFTSLKGGAGKTTLSISLCVSEALKKEKNSKAKFDDIYYFDIDLFGSGSSFILDIENGPYLNECKNFDMITNYYHPIDIKFDEAPNIYNIGFMSSVVDPVLQENKSYFGNSLNDRVSTSVCDDIFMDNLVKLLTKYNSDKRGQLFVFDCSPGFDSFTQKFIDKVNKIGVKTSILFASTYDTSHIKKLERFFKNYTGTVPYEKCTVKIILVDILNSVYLNEVDHPRYDQSVNEELKIKTGTDVILHKAYDKRLIPANSFLKRATIRNINITDLYLLDPELEKMILE